MYSNYTQLYVQCTYNPAFNFILKYFFLILKSVKVKRKYMFHVIIFSKICEMFHLFFIPFFQGMDKRQNSLCQLLITKKKLSKSPDKVMDCILRFNFFHFYALNECIASPLNCDNCFSYFLPSRNVSFLYSQRITAKKCERPFFRTFEFEWNDQQIRHVHKNNMNRIHAFVRLIHFIFEHWSAFSWIFFTIFYIKVLSKNRNSASLLQFESIQFKVSYIYSTV